MLTDQQAHDLLHLAADTVDVANAPAPVPIRRRAWPLVAAAASVVLVVGGVSVLLGSGAEKPDPAPPPTSTDDGRFRLGSDQVPSVFGYSAEDAVAMLDERGLNAYITSLPNECDETPGRAVSVDPPAGTVIEPGATIEVRSPSGNGTNVNAFCVLDTYHRDDAWALIDYANDRGPRPATEKGVDLGPVLEKLRAWSGEIGRFESGRNGQDRLGFPTPTLHTTQADNATCGTLPRRLRGRELLALTIELPQEPTDSQRLPSSCHTAYLEYDAGGVISDAYVPDDYVNDEAQRPADVVGNSVPFATARLESQGLKVEALGRVDCQPEGLVTAQQTYPFSENPQPGTTIFLAYTTERGPCVEDGVEIDTPARSAAEALVEFAKGGQLPPVADTLDLYVGAVRQKRLAGDAAGDPEKWRTSCELSTTSCIVSVLDYAASGHVAVTEPFLRDDGACYVVRGTLPGELTAPDAQSRSASFGDPEPRTCAENWEAQLWLDKEGQIFAVNLLLGNPAAAG